MAKTERIDLPRLCIEITQVDTSTTYAFKGSIDETFLFHQIPVLASAAIVFDLREIRGLNSVGVREWVYFVRQFEAKGHFSFRDVAVPFVDQVNTVPQMLGKATVSSFFAPFYCPRCDEEVNEVLVCQDHRIALLSRHAPALAHAKCGESLEFDALEDCYFHQVERFLG